MCSLVSRVFIKKINKRRKKKNKKKKRKDQIQKNETKSIKESWSIERTKYIYIYVNIYTYMKNAYIPHISI